jgi:hypothetical protein
VPALESASLKVQKQPALESTFDWGSLASGSTPENVHYIPKSAFHHHSSLRSKVSAPGSPSFENACIFDWGWLASGSTPENVYYIPMSAIHHNLRLCSKFMGGVEVFLRVREAKTKKNAILWTPNVTVVPALCGGPRDFVVFLKYEKVTLSSVTQYIYSAVGGAKGGVPSGACLDSAGSSFFLLVGFGFSPQRL